MTILKVSEIFYSLQGEGIYLGTPSIFVRMFGCNFTCAGYSMPKGQLSTEADNVDPSKYQKYEELPLVHTGCDSYPSWHHKFKKFSPKLSVDDVVDRIKTIMGNKVFDRDLHLILTGGEPLLNWQKSYIELIKKLYEKKLVHKLFLTFETNGTQKLQSELCSFISDPDWVEQTTFAISSKLPSSGHSFEEAIRPEIVKSYMYTRESNTSFFKWVISHEEDMLNAIEARYAYIKEGIHWPAYLMPAGGTVESYGKNALMVAGLVEKYPHFRYSPRLQILLYGNAWAT